MWRCSQVLPLRKALSLLAALVLTSGTAVIVLSLERIWQYMPVLLVLAVGMPVRAMIALCVLTEPQV